MAPGRASADSTVPHILEAALEQFAILGISRTSLTDIARRAGVDRATIYRRVGDLSTVTTAALALEGQRLIDEIRADTDAFTGIERGEHAFVATVQRMRNHPIVTRALEVDRAAALLAMADVTPAVMHAATAFVIDEFERATAAGYRPSIPPAALAEITVRLVHSLVVFPDGPPVLTTADELAGYFRTNIAPIWSSSTLSSAGA
jgi:AcrR family transcriptional regulator